MSDQELEIIKRNVILAGRILINKKICEAFGHVSARLPDGEHFIITPRTSLAFVKEVDDLVVMDLKGNRVYGRYEQPLETWLHICIYRRRPDIGGIARTHSFTTSVFSILERDVQTVHDFGSILLGAVPVFEDSSLIETEEIGDRLAAFIGKEKTAALLRGNGTAILGRDVIEATVRAVYLEESAMLQYMAMQIGNPRYFSPREIIDRGSQLLESSHLLRAWRHYCREADKND